MLYDSPLANLVPSRIANFPEQTPGNGGGDGGAVDPSAGAATPPEPLQTTSGTNWEAAYKTLQTTHNALQQKATGLESSNTNLTGQLATHAKELQALTAKLSATELNTQTITEQMTTVSGERDTLKAKVSRLNLIMGEFPHLATFEAQGLLPQADTEDAMRESFTKFSAALKGIETGAVAKIMDGASPDSVDDKGDGKTVLPTEDEAWAEVTRLSGGNDAQAYEAAYQVWLDIVENKSAKK